MKVSSRIICAFLSMIVVLSNMENHPPCADAASKESAILTIFSTSDLHGQSTTYSYDSASNHRNGSLAQISKIIKDEKNNDKNSASLVVDCGDTIFGFGSQSIMQGNIPTSTQYMYDIFSTMHYDAITLGNHDFDYGFDYEKKALKKAGLDSKVVLCNLTNAKTNKTPWASSRIIKKTVKTNLGNKRTIRIGVIGAVIPSLSSFWNWKGILNTKDIYNCVSDEVDLLEEKNVDAIVVLAHCGIGTGEEGEKDDNVAYQLTEIPGVDVVCCGHTHVDFPSNTPMTSYVYSLPGVSKTTNLVNNKILVQEADHGQSLGISKLTISFSGKESKITDKKVRIRKITSKDLEDPSVLKVNAPYDEEIKKMYETVTANVGKTSDNYFGIIEDNTLVQIANEAKIEYAKKLLKQSLPEWINTPVISATSYQNAGASGPDNYISIKDNIKLSDLLNLQTYAQEWAKLYYITGRQIREFLDWQASAFTNPTALSDKLWDDKNTNRLLTESGMIPILSPEWEDWTGYTVFDGIEYTIDPTKPARYDKSGLVKQSNFSRITSLTCNGVQIKDDQKFVWITRHVSKTLYPPIADEVEKQRLLPKTMHITDIIKNYLSEKNANDLMNMRADNNWTVSFPNRGNYLFKTSADALKNNDSRPWNISLLSKENGYGYFQLALPSHKPNDATPMLTVTPLTTKTSGDSVEVAVQTSDVYGIKNLCYTKGFINSTNTNWNGTTIYNNHVFSVNENGIYTVKATDSIGNTTVKHFEIKNIDSTVSTAPDVDTPVNTAQKVTGIASPNAEVFVSSKAGTYETISSEDGSFTCNVDYLCAEESVLVWQKDAKNRLSSCTVVKVKRKGANKPLISTLTNKKDSVSGHLNDSKYCNIVILRGKKAYIAKGTKKQYKRSKVYKNNKKLAIKEVRYKYNNKTGNFKLNVPNIYANQKMKAVSYDWMGRPSMDDSMKVKDVAPNQPVVDTVIAQEGIVYGYIPSPKSDNYQVDVTIGNSRYSASASADGRFAVRTKTVSAGTQIHVTAIDSLTNDKHQRISRQRIQKAVDCFKQVKPKSRNMIMLNDISNKDRYIEGIVKLKLSTTDSIVLVVNKKKFYIKINENGAFSFKISNCLKKKSYIGLLIRSVDGSIKAYNSKIVMPAGLHKPTLTSKKLSEKTRIIHFESNEKANAYVIIGNNVYKCKRKEENKKFLYSVKIKKLSVGDILKVYLKKKKTMSKVIRLTIKHSKKGAYN